jgi:sterol desaturase/sphingolipid hydroxylase (fatty acid hydroxylase superfamily)
MLTSKTILRVEHSRVAYWADFGLYAVTIIVLVIFLFTSDKKIGYLQMGSFLTLGLVAWTFLEYAIHRFVLHGIEPFKTLHYEHHLRPRALILAPTLLTITLIALLIFTPAFLLTSALPASAITVGLLIGYFGYAITHHAIHHWSMNWLGNSGWMRTLKRRHAVHHMQSFPTNYGVTSLFWDRAFGSYRKL